MKKTEREPEKHIEKYTRETEVSSSSRYSKPETFRTGSRYSDKADAEHTDSKKARRAAQDTQKAARAASALALRQAERESRKVKEAKLAGGLIEPETAMSADGDGAASGKPAGITDSAAAKGTGAAENTEKTAGSMAALKGYSWQRILLTVLAAIIVISYVVVAVVFSGRFYPGTTIFGVNASAKTVEWTKNQVENKVGEYQLTLEERDGKTETLTAAQIGLHYDDQGAIETRMKKQYSFLWPVMMLARRNTETQIGAVYDRENIDNAIGKLSCVKTENQVPPENAYVGETPDGYAVIPEVEGSTLRMDVFREAVVSALDDGETRISLEERACYTNPSVLQDNEDLVADRDKRNELLGADITLDFGDREEHIDTQQIMEFIERGSDGSYRFSDEAIWNYTAQLAEKYDTYGGTRTFHTSIGTVETLYGGDYGWAIEQNETAQTILDDLRAKKVEKIEPIYAYMAMNRGENDIGDTYVEVCISRQEMWCYKDGVLVTDTPVVTGNPNVGNATPSGGVWAIDGKMEKFVLVGEGYRAPVDYWMPFNGNVGIHDLQTRYWFGSTIYLSSGSHGCVNTPLDAVEKIYNAVSVGTPVIVYEGEGTTDYGASAWQ